MKRRILVITALAALWTFGAAAHNLRGEGAIPGTTEGTDTLKVAVASTGPGADAAISQEAARAPYILIFDQKGELVDVVENRDVPAQRAGGQVALLLKEKGVTHFIAGQFGRNLISALEEAEIKRVEKTGPALEAVKQLIG
jgi:predicted Fe-Mo cluster-binding NifX family protein